MSENILRVRPTPKNTQVGQVFWKGNSYPCALGKGGVLSATDKQEGDDATPAGLYPILWVYNRPDRVTMPELSIPLQPLTKESGWCDEPLSDHYNKPVALPHHESAETMWREDACYDVVLVLGHNVCPTKPHRGSAIFMHIAREGMTPTRGCVALTKDDLLAILPEITNETMVRVHLPNE